MHMANVSTLLHVAQIFVSSFHYYANFLKESHNTGQQLLQTRIPQAETFVTNLRKS